MIQLLTRFFWELGLSEAGWDLKVLMFVVWKTGCCEMDV